MNYDKNTDKILSKAGFIEKQVTLDDGTILNYGEGANNGIPLLLIHGQSTYWKNYVKVLPELTKHYHVFAIDCHGHGKSSKNRKKYTAEKMCKDFIWFIENVIGQPAIVSGHSSGGLLTAWLASNSPQNVIGIVIEDAPFFATEPQRCQKTFAWLDQFQVIHKFLNQTKETNYTRFYLENCYMQTFFGASWTNIKKYAFNYINKNPEKNLRIFYLPPAMNKTFDLLSGKYDLHFGDTFYDCSWFKNFDQTEVLSKIKCPSVLIHTNWSYNDDGILLGAMDGTDAQKAHELIVSNKLMKINSGHNSHDEKPKEFNKIMIEFLDNINVKK
jgi:pimeloyl-ACP methyl ester carboxylesterase